MVTVGTSHNVDERENRPDRGRKEKGGKVIFFPCSSYMDQISYKSQRLLKSTQGVNPIL